MMSSPPCNSSSPEPCSLTALLHPPLPTFKCFFILIWLFKLYFAIHYSVLLEVKIYPYIFNLHAHIHILFLTRCFLMSLSFSDNIRKISMLHILPPLSHPCCLAVWGLSPWNPWDSLQEAEFILAVHTRCSIVIWVKFPT